jgi:hypothetical protein
VTCDATARGAQPKPHTHALSDPNASTGGPAGDFSPAPATRGAAPATAGGDEWGAGTRAWASSIDAALRDVTRAQDAADALAAAARLDRYVEHLTADLVAEARAQHPPLSWARIGTALGVSRQAANERFSEAAQAGAAARRYRRVRRMEALREQTSGGQPSHP